MASLNALAGLIFTTVFAGILIASPVAGFRPLRAFLLTRTDLPMPGSKKAPFFLVSAIASAAYSSMRDRTPPRVNPEQVLKFDLESRRGDYTFYRLLLERDAKPTQNYHVLRKYREQMKEGDSVINASGIACDSCWVEIAKWKGEE